MKLPSLECAVVAVALALSACAVQPKQPAVALRDECQVEPQPLSCAAASEPDAMRTR